MKQVLNRTIKAGSRESHEPRLIGSIVDEMLQGWHTNTDLSVTLKTILRSDRRAKTGKSYQGILKRDVPCEDYGFDDPHFTFIEALPQTEKRNPRIFNGRFITATRRDNGSIRLNFKELDACGEFSIKRYAEGVRREIFQALEGLVEKG